MVLRTGLCEIFTCSRKPNYLILDLRSENTMLSESLFVPYSKRPFVRIEISKNFLHKRITAGYDWVTTSVAVIHFDRKDNTCQGRT